MAARVEFTDYREGVGTHFGEAMSEETPLVPRAVRTGGLLLALAALQLVVIGWIVASEKAGYSMSSSSFASLGAGPLPWSLLFNASLVVFGALAIVGLMLSWSAFDEHPSRGLGLFALLVAAMALLCLGVVSELRGRFPAAAVPTIGFLIALWAGVGFVVVAFAMHRHERWRVSRAYTLATGAVMLAASALYALRLFSLSGGLLERVVVGIALAWVVLEGLHLALLHRFAPGLTVKVASA